MLRMIHVVNFHLWWHVWLLIAPVSVSRPHDKFIRATRKRYGRNSKFSERLKFFKRLVLLRHKLR
jgi:hypothetical protein